MLFLTLKIKLGDFGEAIELKSYHQVNNNSLNNENNNYNNNININNEREAETRKMTILGTIAYMAPELVEGRKYYNELIDDEIYKIVFLLNIIDDKGFQSNFELTSSK